MKAYEIKDKDGNIIRYAVAIELGTMQGSRKRKVIYEKTARESDVSITLGIYTHSDLELQRVAAEAIDRRFHTPSDDDEAVA